MIRLGAEKVAARRLVDVSAEDEIGSMAQDGVADRGRSDVSAAGAIAAGVAWWLVTDQDRGRRGAPQRLLGGIGELRLGALVGRAAEGETRRYAGEGDAADDARSAVEVDLFGTQIVLDCG